MILQDHEFPLIYLRLKAPIIKLVDLFISQNIYATKIYLYNYFKLNTSLSETSDESLTGTIMMYIIPHRQSEINLDYYK